jgi:hypothetical protein
MNLHRGTLIGRPFSLAQGKLAFRSFSNIIPKVLLQLSYHRAIVSRGNSPMAGVNQSACGNPHTICPSQPLNHNCPAAPAPLPDFHLSFDCFASESRISNRHTPQLEPVVTLSKQTTVVLSNRYKSPPPGCVPLLQIAVPGSDHRQRRNSRRPSHSQFRNPHSRLTRPLCCMMSARRND